MKPVERQKICSNCDGRIAFEADTCPYCGTPLIQQESSTSRHTMLSHQSIEDSLTSLYSPPYSNKSSYMKTDQPAAPQPREAYAQNAHATSMGKAPYAAQPRMEHEEKVEDKNSFLSLFLFLLGSNLLVLGLIQFFFSEEGVLRLEWDAKYWFIYCLFALPLVYLGFKKMKQVAQPSQGL